MGIRANNLFHHLQDSVEAYVIKLEDRNPKMFQKVLDVLGSPHLDMEKTGSALLSPDLAHVLSDEVFKEAMEGGYHIWS